MSLIEYQWERMNLTLQGLDEPGLGNLKGGAHLLRGEGEGGWGMGHGRWGMRDGGGALWGEDRRQQLGCKKLN